MASPAPVSHQRTKSTGILKGLVSKGHSRAETAVYDASPAALMLPPDHPHSQLRTANRTQPIPTNAPTSPRKPQESKEQPARGGMHKKSMSSVSLRSLGIDKERPSRESGRTWGEDSTSPKKIKSSANLVSLFRKNKQPEAPRVPVRDKENTTPPSTSNTTEPLHTPIWAQFSSQPLQDVSATSKVPLNDQRRSGDEDIAIYSPQDYSPSKQRNFFEHSQPSLQNKSPPKPRPKSVFLPTSGSTASLLDTFKARKSTSVERPPLADTKGNEGRAKESFATKTTNPRGFLSRASSDYGQTSNAPKAVPDSPKKQSRVMAAVAAFNGKSKANTRSATSPTSPVKLDPKVVDVEFESVLVSVRLLMIFDTY